MRLEQHWTTRLALPVPLVARSLLQIGLMFGLFLLLIYPIFSNPNAIHELIVNSDYSRPQLVPLDVQLNLKQFKISANPYFYLLWQQPYLIAVLLLLLGLHRWIRRTTLDWLETNLLLGSISLMTAVLLPFLVAWSWWLILLSLFIIGLSVEWRIRYCPGLRWSGIIQSKSWVADKLWLTRLLLAGLAFSLFMVVAPSFNYDTRLFLSWDSQIHFYGPLYIYQHITNLDYPPLIVYLLWIYGWVLTPFGLITNLQVFKIVASLAALSGTVITWLITRQKQANNIVHTRPGLRTGLVLLTLSPALLFNPAGWGQVDALLNLMLLLAFWLLYRLRPFPAGMWLGLLLIFKPQAWFVLPLLTVILIKKAGWKKGLMAGVTGLLLATGLTILAFGGHLGQFLKFWAQPALAGKTGTGTYEAFNLMWLLGFYNKPASFEISIAGLILIALIYLVVLLPVIKGVTSLPEEAFGAAIIIIAFFLFSIKMHERYLYYSLPLLGLVCFYNRRMYKPFLLLNLCCLLNTLHSYLKSNRPRYGNFYFWPELTGPVALSWLVILIWLYLFCLYLRSVVGPLIFKPGKLSTALQRRGLE